jgi:hypothetical protein
MSQIRRFHQDQSCIFSEDFSDLNYLRKIATIAGNPQPVQTPYGLGLSLDGVVDDINFGTLFKLENDCTVVLRFKFTQLTGQSNTFPRVISFEGSVAGIAAFITTTRRLRVSITDDNGNALGATTIGTAIDDLSWLDLVIVADGADTRWYYNASKVLDSTVGFNTGFTFDVVSLIGDYSPGGQEALMTAKQLLLFNRVLSTQEISNITLDRNF